MNKKNNYETPEITMTLTVLEHSIASGSSNANPGTGGSPSTPGVDDWDNGPGEDYGDFDL